ncbi:hypothetical protein RHMOL_Rhmol07G0045300 [Rhododendron molle]|uniref:Uncharacterized protein n=1 Tax=Rhododendron molle TaxID=49168 RepID=A0ACC0MWZ9_RHOML|nr:hypothetical protein RHMOL_Rhmol07G0045300 [Rhododendron molle]
MGRGRRSSDFVDHYGYDLLLGSIAAFYVFMVPYTKVEESFNVQAMHDVLYHRHHLEEVVFVISMTIWSSLELFRERSLVGVIHLMKRLTSCSKFDLAILWQSFSLRLQVPLGAILVSILATPVVSVMSLLHLPKIYSLFAVRLVLGCIILWTIRYFRIQELHDLTIPDKQNCLTPESIPTWSDAIPKRGFFMTFWHSSKTNPLRKIRKKFGGQVEAFFVILTGIQFHVLFYCTRPLPNIMALGLVNLAYGNWLKGHFYAALNCLIFATLIFRCDILLLLCPLGLELLLTKSITLWKALKCCIGTALFCIGLTVLVDTIMWKKFVWPEFQVLWFNSVLNRSSEWGLGVFLDRRVVFYILPIVSFVLLYSKLPHKELRFVIISVPMFNLSAAIAASRIYNNRKKSFWKLLHIILLGLLMVSLGCTIITFMASYENYPSGYALKDLHKKDHLHMRNSKASKESLLQSEKLVYPHVGSLTNNSTERWVHIDPFSAMNGISRFCEYEFPWRYLDYGLSIVTVESHDGFWNPMETYFGVINATCRLSLVNRAENMACLCKVLKSIPVYDHVNALQLVLFAYKVAAGVYLTGEICIEGGGGHGEWYCKEEGIPIQEFDQTNFTYLLK